jgi:two-component system CheB/CheR fusion protein
MPAKRAPSELPAPAAQSIPPEILTLFRQVLNAAETSIVVTDARLPDNPIIYHNAAFERTSGYAASEIDGRNCRFLQGPETDPQAIAKIRDAIAHERSCRVTLLNYRKNGTSFWNDLALTPVHDAQGQLTHFVGVQNDVTDRKSVDSALRESEERFRLAFDDSSVAMTMVGIDDRFIRVNEAYCRLVGNSQKELLQMGIRDVIDPEDTVELSRNRLPALLGETPSYHVELRVRHKDGHRIWVDVSSSMVRDESGRLRYSVGQLLDITDRKEAESQLKESQQRLTLATEAAQIGIWDWDLVANNLVWDDRMFVLYGISRQDFTGNYDVWRNALHPEDRARAEADAADALSGIRDFQSRYRIVWPSGEIRFIEGRTIIQRSPDGSPVRVVGINWDFTEHKRLEQQMVHTEKLAALGELVAGVAHEINNPLAAISGCAQLLQRHTDPQVRGDAATIESMVQRAARIVRSLRTYARPSGDTHTTISFNDVVHSALDIISSKLRHANVQLTLELGSDLCPVLLNVGEMEQVIVNLLSNAEYALRSKPMEERSIHISTSSRREINALGTARDTCVFTIQDTGSGIPESVQARIFDPFFSTKEVGEGSGLGLYISHGIIIAHGGTTEVESREGIGTTITISLPSASGVDSRENGSSV